MERLVFFRCFLLLTLNSVGLLAWKKRKANGKGRETGLKNISGSVLSGWHGSPCLCKIMVMLSLLFFAQGKKPDHENVVFDPRIYVAEKEGCLLQ